MCTPLFGYAGDRADVYLRIRHTPAGLSLVGDVSSIAHESILRATTQRHFGATAAKAAVFRLERTETPTGWALVTDAVLEALSQTQSATAEISSSAVRIRGVTGKAAEWRAAVRDIERTLVTGMRLQDDVEVVTPVTSFQASCRQQLRQILAERRIEFRATQPTPRPSSFGALDAIAELSIDCPALVLRVTGHTDATGIETDNRQLSLARAQATLAYLKERGVPAARLEAAGVGSEQPLVAGVSQYARRLNRRVEFAFVDGPVAP